MCPGPGTRTGPDRDGEAGPASITYCRTRPLTRPAQPGRIREDLRRGHHRRIIPAGLHGICGAVQESGSKLSRDSHCQAQPLGYPKAGCSTVMEPVRRGLDGGKGWPVGRGECGTRHRRVIARGAIR
jgi:hypothetical protein